jgi:hypothetical protein
VDVKQASLTDTLYAKAADGNLSRWLEGGNVGRETQIRISIATRERLRKYGVKGEKWDSIVSKILDEVEKIREYKMVRENSKVQSAVVKG